MNEEISRPPILDKDGKLSEYVKCAIRDRDGKLVGIVVADERVSMICFLDRVSTVIVFDKLNKQFSIANEVFPKDPREMLEGLL